MLADTVGLASLASLVTDDGILYISTSMSDLCDTFTSGLTVILCFSTKAFCFSTESGLTPTIFTLDRLNTSFSDNASLSWQACLVHPYEPMWFNVNKIPYVHCSSSAPTRT